MPHAGAFDGILGVMLGVALVERLDGRRLPFASSAISSSVGSRPNTIQSVRSARFIFWSRSTMCTGMRIVLALSASALATACRIHHVAYVENL